MTRSILIAISLGLLSACGSAAVVRRDPRGGEIALRGPYVPAMQEARERMVDHCQGRYVTVAGKDGRELLYRCANAPELEFAHNQQPLNADGGRP